MSLRDIFDNAKAEFLKLFRTKKAESVSRQSYKQPEEWYDKFMASSSTVWMQYNGTEYIDDSFPWKIHVFASSIEDYYSFAEILSESLIRQDVTFKTIGVKWDWNREEHLHAILDSVEPSGRSNSQYGKAFTIYFNRAHDMYLLAKYLDGFFKLYNMVISKPDSDKLDVSVHNLGTEKQYGSSGRVFYRAERDKNGEYIRADDARKINPEQPHNPYNMQDPIEQGIEQDNEVYGFISSHLRGLNPKEYTIVIDPEYKQHIIPRIRACIPKAKIDMSDDGRICLAHNNVIYIRAFFNGLEEYIKTQQLRKKTIQRD